MSVWNRVCNMNNTLDLSGKWLVRWADGQRGGLHLHSLEDTDGIRWFDAQVLG